MTRPLRPRATASIAVAPAMVTDRTAHLVLGLEPRAYRELVLRLHVRHVRIGRRLVARVDEVLAGFDQFASEAALASAAPVRDDDDGAEPETVDEVLRRLGRRRTATAT